MKNTVDIIFQHDFSVVVAKYYWLQRENVDHFFTIGRAPGATTTATTTP